MKKILTLLMALGLLVAFTSVSVAMGICGGPKITQAMAEADPADTSTQADEIVVAQAEMTQDTSPVTKDGDKDGENAEDSN